MRAELSVQLKRLQENLPAIRKIAGWRAIDLGTLLGVTKQSVSNLETRKSKMTLIQYIAIRHMIDYQIKAHPENKALAHIVPLLLDISSLDDQKYKQVQNAAEEIANAAAGGVSDSVLTAISDTLLSGKDKPEIEDWTTNIMAGIESCHK